MVVMAGRRAWRGRGRVETMMMMMAKKMEHRKPNGRHGIYVLEADEMYIRTITSTNTASGELNNICSVGIGCDRYNCIIPR